MTWWSRLLESGSRQPSRSRSDLPYYTAVERSRPGKARRDFSELENSPEIDRLRAEFESELLSPPRLPAEDEPLLTSLFVAPSGFLRQRCPIPRLASSFSRLLSGRPSTRASMLGRSS